MIYDIQKLMIFKDVICYTCWYIWITFLHFEIFFMKTLHQLTLNQLKKENLSSKSYVSRYLQNEKINAYNLLIEWWWVKWVSSSSHANEITWGSWTWADIDELKSKLFE